MSRRFVLFTNLDYVLVSGVRTHSHALLLCDYGCNDDSTRLGPRFVGRGFGTHPADETFDIRLPSIEYRTITGSSQSVFIGDDGKETPLVQGLVLFIKADVGELRFDLIAGMPLERGAKGEVDISEHTDILDVWDVLPRKVAQYWSAPYIPIPQTAPASQLRRLYEGLPKGALRR